MVAPGTPCSIDRGDSADTMPKCVTATCAADLPFPETMDMRTTQQAMEDAREFVDNMVTGVGLVAGSSGAVKGMCKVASDVPVKKICKLGFLAGSLLCMDRAGPHISPSRAVMDQVRRVETIKKSSEISRVTNKVNVQ